MAKNNIYNFVCRQCKKKDVANQKKTYLCSEECRKIYRRMYSPCKELGVSSPTVGAITELKVSVWLMEKGYSVFRSLSSACFCDLVAIKNNEVMYLEVRTGYITTNGTFSYLKTIHKGNGIPTHFGIFTQRDNQVRIIKID